MSESELSKRERQKKRREAKLAQERAAEARARRTRLLVFALVGIIFLGLIGVAVANNRAERAAQLALEARVQERLEELGCTEDEVQEDRGQGHLDAATLAQQPPDAIYPSRPATSGEHFANWIKTGVYDQVIDERALVHNLEHGYVLAYYDEGLAEEQLEQLKTYGQEQIDDAYPKLIVSPWDGDLPEDKNLAFAAWNVRQTCEDFDSEVLSVFLTEYHSASGMAPDNEKTLPPHLEEGNGTIDPGDEPFLLPPLGESGVPAGNEGMDESGATEGAATTEGAEPEATEATS